jgi:LytS/YehU family sensor histidine kinase
MIITGSSYGSSIVRKSHFSKLEIERPRRFERPPGTWDQTVSTDRPQRYLQQSGDSSRGGMTHMQRRNLSNSMMAVLLIFSLSLTYGLFERYRENEKTRMEIEKEKIQTELNSLKQQVNPHFLFNSLNSIYSLANRQSEKTTEAVLKLSDMLRYMIYDAEKSTVPLKQEFDGLKNFIELQKLRLTDKTKLNINIQENPDDYMIEPLLLLPVVENAFKFGSDNLHKSNINVEASVEEGMLFFACSNTVIPGLKEQKSKDPSGIGLRNVRRRLELLYPGKHELNIVEVDGSYLVKVEVLLREV